MSEQLAKPWTMSKCRCGHPSCKQYTISVQGSVGFDEDIARLIIQAPVMKDVLQRAYNQLATWIDNPLWDADDEATLEAISAVLVSIKGPADDQA